MEMSANEIIRKYKDRPTFQRMQELADLNGTTTKVIRDILRAGGYEENELPAAKNSQGRPKKKTETPESPADQILQSIDATLSHNNQKESIKNNLILDEKPNVTIPKVVIDMCNDKIQEINRKIGIHSDIIDSLNNERNELIDFLNRGEKNEKEGIYGEVQTFKV